MTRPLAEPVYVAGRFFAAGDVPDDEHAALITSPRAWGDEQTPSPRGAAPAFDPTVPATSEGVTVKTDPAEGDEEEVPAGLFDPSAEGNGLDEVNNHLANADEEEVRRVLALEATGKKRKGILNGPYAPDED